MRRFVIVLLVGISAGGAGAGCGKSADADQAEQPRAAGQTSDTGRYQDSNSLTDLTSPEKFSEGIWYVPRRPAMTTFSFTHAQVQFLQEHRAVRLITAVPNYRDGQLIGVWFYTEARPTNEVVCSHLPLEKFTTAELQQETTRWGIYGYSIAGVTSVTGDDGKTEEVVVVFQKR